MKQFEINKTYYTRSSCDHNCIIKMTVLKRTAKTITANVDGEGVKTFRPYTWRDAEHVRPWGSFSMAPSIDATEDKVLLKDWEKVPA
jgi:hypothetical protein